MQITFESPRRLRIELDRNDMCELDITYEEMDYANQHTREVIRELLGRIGGVEGFGSETGRTLIEVFPTDNEGCVIYFTALQTDNTSSQPRMRKLRMEPSVYEFESSGNMLSAVAQLGRMLRRPIRCELYLYEGRYRIIIISPSADRQTAMLMSEFGRLVGTGRIYAALTAEHGRLLTPDVMNDFRATP